MFDAWAGAYFVVYSEWYVVFACDGKKSNDVMLLIKPADVELFSKSSSYWRDTLSLEHLIVFICGRHSSLLLGKQKTTSFVRNVGRCARFIGLLIQKKITYYLVVICDLYIKDFWKTTLSQNGRFVSNYIVL